MRQLTYMLIVLGALCHFLAVHIGAYASFGGQGMSIPLILHQRAQTPPNFVYRSNISVANSHEYAYLARVDIGGQQFLALIDTGSADLWVVSTECGEEDCQDVAKYRPTSTLQHSNTSFDLNYLLGSVSGEVGADVVTLGSYEITSQVFAMANKTSGLGLAATGNSGILGLSFPLEAAIPDTSGRTLLENIFATFDDADRYFAFKLGRDSTDSSFSIGELDSKYANSTSEFAFNPVFPAFDSVYDYWKLPLHSLTVNSTIFNLSASRISRAPSPIAVLDTGTTLVLGPTVDVDRLWNSIGGARQTDTGWQVRCDHGILIGFVLGESGNQREFIIDPSDLSWKQAMTLDDGWCLGGIQANDGVSSGDWLLGDTFLRNVYAIHHAGVDGQPPKIGLLGTTDANNSLAIFRKERGDDTTPSVPVLSSPEHHTSTGIGSGAIVGLSVVAGFFFGVFITCLAYYCTVKPRLKRYRR